MKKTVLTFGLISGAFSAVMMLLTPPLPGSDWFRSREVLGRTLIVLSFLLVFFGVRSYRENVGGGTVSFGRAFAVGLLITLISSSCYVITWEFIYFKLAPGFADKFSAHAIAQARASGANEEKIDETRRQMAELKVMLDKPLVNAAMTFMEPLPVGLIVTLVSAGV